MSMDYWGIVLYGVSDNNLVAGNKENGESWSFWEIQELYNDDEHSDVWDVKLENGKIVPLYMEITEDDSYLGFEPIYPWNIKSNHEILKITEKDVADAIVKFLEPFGYDKDAIYANCDYVSDYNCC